VMAGEVAGSVSERDLLDAVFGGRATLTDPEEKHLGAALLLVGSGESVEAVRQALEHVDAVMVVDDGKPVGVLTRHDLLGFFAG